jgi:hypothetical protein
MKILSNRKISPEACGWSLSLLKEPGNWRISAGNNKNRGDPVGEGGTKELINRVDYCSLDPH